MYNAWQTPPFPQQQWPPGQMVLHQQPNAAPTATNPPGRRNHNRNRNRNRNRRLPDSDQPAPVTTPDPPSSPEHVLPDTRMPHDQAPDFSIPGSVVVEVGQPSKIFHVNEKVLCASSKFVTTALKPVWTKDGPRYIDLRQDQPALFNIYVNWLYGNKLFAETSEKESFADEGYKVYRRLIDLYALGDRLVDIGFKDAICDAVAAVLTKTRAENGVLYCMGTGDVNHLYDNTCAGSALRRLVVQSVCHVSGLQDLLDEEHNSTYLRDVAIARDAGKERTLEEAAARCDFHEHAAGKENCYKTKKALS